MKQFKKITLLQTPGQLTMMHNSFQYFETLLRVKEPVGTTKLLKVRDSGVRYLYTGVSVSLVQKLLQTHYRNCPVYLVQHYLHWKGESMLLTHLIPINSCSQACIWRWTAFGHILSILTPADQLMNVSDNTQNN